MWAISCNAAATPNLSSWGFSVAMWLVCFVSRKGAKGRHEESQNLCGFAPVAPLRENCVIMAIASINPATGETLKTFNALSAEQIEAKLQLASDTFRTYSHTSFSDRARMMTRAAEILEARKHEFGMIMTLEMG